MSSSSSPPDRRLRVLLTRPAEQAASWSIALERAGLDVILYPTIRVEPPSSWAALDAATASLDRYAWIIFTSAAAARFAAPRLPRPLIPSVAAVGSQSARALEALGVQVSLVPSDERQEGLVAAFAHLKPGTRLLFPRAEGGRDELVSALHRRGCLVDVVPASRTVTIPDLPPPPPFDVAVFASPSALAGFLAAHGPEQLRRGPAVIAIGPTTGAAAAAAQIPVSIARSAHIESVITAITESHQERGAR